MKKIVAVALSLIAFAAAGTVWAQRGYGRGRGGGRGWGPRSVYCRMYDPKTVETASGVISGIENFIPERGMSTGVLITLQTDKETIPVHLGPSWYVDAQATKLAVNDRIEVKGSRIAFNGKPALVAREIRVGKSVLQFRNADGLPQWSRRR